MVAGSRGTRLKLCHLSGGLRSHIMSLALHCIGHRSYKDPNRQERKGKDTTAPWLDAKTALEEKWDKECCSSSC